MINDRHKKSRYLKGYCFKPLKIPSYLLYMISKASGILDTFISLEYLYIFLNIDLKLL